jgi:hypothetical protein
VADTTLRIDLDPKKVLQGVNDISEAVKKLSDVLDTTLGKEAPKSVHKMEEAVEKGSNTIASQFRNLGQRIREDLKTAFDVGKLFAGFKLAETLGQGIKEVFNLEKAFDRLNTRLQLTGKNYQDFKANIGKAVASTGQKLEDIFPGVEIAASKGNVKSPEELALIAKSLGQVKAATGENTEALTESIVEILKTQGKKVTGQSFKEVLDTLQGTRVTGAFHTAGEAGGAIGAITKGLSPEQLKKMGLGTRELGGLAAQASRAGEGGPEILQHILQMATQAGGKNLINSIFGTQLFKGDKLDVNAFSKINKQQYGKYSEQVLSQVTGADQAGLARFLDKMKESTGDFKKVTQGSNETATQFKLATDNLASGIDKFKQRTINATRTIGEDLAEAAHELLKGNLKGAIQDVRHGAGSFMDNKGALLGATGLAAGSALLMGGGLKGLMKGGLGGSLAKAAGVEPVYVVNAMEIGAASSLGLMGKMGLFGLAAGSGLMAGSALANSPMGESIAENTGLNKLIDTIIDTFDVGGKKKATQELKEAKIKSAERGGKPLDFTPDNLEALKNAVAHGMVLGMDKVKINTKMIYSNPSKPTGAGGHI